MKVLLNFQHLNDTMARGGVIDYSVSIVFTGIVGLVVVAVLNAILTSPAAISPGDPLYPAQQSMVRTFSNILPLIVPGGIGAALLVWQILSE